MCTILLQLNGTIKSICKENTLKIRFFEPFTGKCTVIIIHEHWVMVVCRMVQSAKSAV